MPILVIPIIGLVFLRMEKGPSTMRKEIVMPKKTDEPKPDILKVSCEAVAAYRVSDMTYESIKFTIKDGMVVAQERLTRAPDVSQNAIGAAQRFLWQKLTKQSTRTVFGDA